MMPSDLPDFDERFDQATGAEPDLASLGAPLPRTAQPHEIDPNEPHVWEDLELSVSYVVQAALERKRAELAEAHGYTAVAECARQHANRLSRKGQALTPCSERTWHVLLATASMFVGVAWRLLVPWITRSPDATHHREARAADPLDIVRACAGATVASGVEAKSREVRI